jgi:hypothetical protein
LIVATRFAIWLLSAACQTAILRRFAAIVAAIWGRALLQRRRGGGRPAGVALVVRPAAELVGLRAARKTGLAVGEETAVRDLPLEARLLACAARSPSAPAAILASYVCVIWFVASWIRASSSCSARR